MVAVGKGLGGELLMGFVVGCTTLFAKAVGQCASMAVVSVHRC